MSWFDILLMNHTFVPHLIHQSTILIKDDILKKVTPHRNERILLL